MSSNARTYMATTLLLTSGDASVAVAWGRQEKSLASSSRMWYLQREDRGVQVTDR
jgi:hypothetical protein